jgi:hypothetical protein
MNIKILTARQLTKIGALLAPLAISFDDLMSGDEKSLEALVDKAAEAKIGSKSAVNAEALAKAEARLAAIYSAAGALKIDLSAAQESDMPKILSDAIAKAAAVALAKNGLSEMPGADVLPDPTSPNRNSAALNLAGLDAVAASYRTKLLLN